MSDVVKNSNSVVEEASTEGHCKMKLGRSPKNPYPYPRQLLVTFTIFLLFCRVQSARLEQGHFCDDGKVWMVVEGQMACKNCGEDEFYDKKWVKCFPCGGHFTNKIRSLRRKCKDKRIVAPPTVAVEITKPSTKLDTIPTNPHKPVTTTKNTDENDNEDIKLPKEKPPIGDNTEDKKSYENRLDYNTPNKTQVTKSEYDPPVNVTDAGDKEKLKKNSSVGVCVAIGIFVMMGLLSFIALIFLRE